MELRARRDVPVGETWDLSLIYAEEKIVMHEQNIGYFAGKLLLGIPYQRFHAAILFNLTVCFRPDGRTRRASTRWHV